MFFLAAMFLASACTCAVYGKRRLLQSAHVQALAKNMAAKKNTFLRFCSRSYVSVCKYSVMSWTNDGFRRYAHARVITDFKNMADYMKSERWLKASEKAKTKTRTTATRLQGTSEKR